MFRQVKRSDMSILEEYLTPSPSSYLNSSPFLASSSTYSSIHSTLHSSIHASLHSNLQKSRTTESFRIQVNFFYPFILALK